MIKNKNLFMKIIRKVENVLKFSINEKEKKIYIYKHFLPIFQRKGK